MNRHYVESSMIDSIGYDASSAILEVEFKSNHAVWNYPDFPGDLWHEFDSAESKGKFFHAYIRNTYKGYRV